MHRNKKGHKSCQPVRVPGGPSEVTVAPSVLDQFYNEIARFPPERGGFLFGNFSEGLIEKFVLDSGAHTGSAFYYPSEEAPRIIQTTEREHNMQFMGVIHSHPGALDRPSGPDVEAMDSLLELNPHMPFVVAPIITHLPARESHELALTPPRGKPSTMKASFFFKVRGTRSYERYPRVALASGQQESDARAIRLAFGQVALLRKRFSWPEPRVTWYEREGVRTILVDFDLRSTKLVLLLAGFPVAAPAVLLRTTCPPPSDGVSAEQGPAKCGPTVSLTLSWQLSVPVEERLVLALADHVLPPHCEVPTVEPTADASTYELWWGPRPSQPFTQDADRAKMAGWRPLLISRHALTTSSLLAGCSTELAKKIFMRSRDCVGSGTEKRVAVFGCGSVGSALAESIARNGCTEIDLIDFDEVEYHNLGRTTYGTTDVGLRKVDALARRLLDINPRLVVHCHGTQDIMTEPLYFMPIIKASQVVVAATDDAEAQKRICRMAYGAGVYSIYIGLYEAAEGGEIYLCSPKHSSPCYFCATQRMTERVELMPQNYGLGRLQAVSAISADISSVVALGAKLCLALLVWLESGRAKPLGQFAASIMDNKTWMLQTSHYAKFWVECLAKVGRRPNACEFALGSFWFPPDIYPQTVESRAECRICGPHRTPLADVDWSPVGLDDIRLALTRASSVAIAQGHDDGRRNSFSHQPEQLQDPMESEA